MSKLTRISQYDWTFLKNTGGHVVIEVAYYHKHQTENIAQGFSDLGFKIVHVDSNEGIIYAINKDVGELIRA